MHIGVIAEPAQPHWRHEGLDLVHTNLSGIVLEMNTNALVVSDHLRRVIAHDKTGACPWSLITVGDIFVVQPIIRAAYGSPKTTRTVRHCWSVYREPVQIYPASLG